MNLDWIPGMSQKELEKFKSVCNQLLSRTFIVRTVYRPDKGRINNPDYTFLATHFEQIQEYLYVLDWELRKDDFNGYFYVLNTDEANCCALNLTATGILLALRMIYDEDQENMGFEHDVICTVRDVLEKVVTDYAILSAKPNMREVKQALTFLDNHSVIQRVSGKYNESSCKLAILPTILTVVSSDKLDAVVKELNKEADDEEAEADPAD